MERAAQKRRRRRKVHSEYFFDYSLLFIVLFLLGFGLIMIYSASSYEAYESYGDASYYLKRQLIADGMGLLAMTFLAFFDYHRLRKYGWVGYIVSLVLIGMVRSPLGVSSHNATRWIRIPGIGFNLQPAEFAKLAMILLLAGIVVKQGRKVYTMKGFLKVMAIPLPVALAIYVITDNLSSAIIILGIAVLMVFVASPDYRKFVLMALALILLAAVVILMAVNLGEEAGSFRLARIQAWLDPESQADGKGYQTLQALYAIGSGGIWGKGLGQSMQKLSYLPESQNDMIFSIICEELGLFGALAVIFMFVMLLWRMMIIADNAPDLFGAMLVVGVMGHIAIQAVLNIAVVTNSIPNTGISLPFISYGGSSALFLLMELGIVLNVARGIPLSEKETQ